MKRILLSPSTHKTHSLDESIIPLINVVFLLLIFFLVAGSLTETVTQGIVPPRSTSSLDQKADGQGLSMNAQGQLYWLGQETTVVQLEALWSALDLNTFSKLPLSVDAKTRSDKVLALLDKLQEMGVHQVKISTIMVKAE